MTKTLGKSIISGRDRPVSAGAAYLRGFFARFFVALGVKGCGGVFSIRRMISSARLSAFSSICGRAGCCDLPMVGA